MVAKKRKADLAAIPLDRQPAQLELFRMISDANYTNAFEFYEAVPRFVVARWSAAIVARNPDGTIAPLQKTFTVSGKRYEMLLQPAYVQKGKTRPTARFPGVREELVEFVLFKLAMDSGYFTREEDGTATTDNFTLFTSLYEIRQQLESHARTYSYDQIREALEVLAKTTIHLSSDDEEDLIFSPIADFGFFGRGREPLEVGRNATVYIRFNALISKSILARKWRQINYTSVMESQAYLVRWLRRMLSLKFTYAAPDKTFNIKLSTLIENSGVSLYSRLSDNLKQVEAALADMKDVVARYAVLREWTTSAATGKGRVLADAKIVIRPTRDFVHDQVLVNKHHAKLAGAGRDASGAPALEPDRKTSAGYRDYVQQRQRWLGSHSMDDPDSNDGQ